jgi:hypothetical protein
MTRPVGDALAQVAMDAVGAADQANQVLRSQGQASQGMVFGDGHVNQYIGF